MTAVAATADTVARPLFSVVIPTYNRSGKLRRALDSLTRQTMGDFEVLVCDDGSTDDTAAVVRGFADFLRLRYFHEENWGGPARPRNVGIEAARGEWVCFLDADDWWEPRKLAAVAEVVEGADLVYHDARVETPAGTARSRKRGRTLSSPVFVDLLTKGCPLVTSSVCVRRELLVQCRGFAEERGLVAVEDYDLWLRIALLTERFVYLPESLGAYWSGEGNISGFSRRYIERERLLFERHAPRLAPGDRREAEALLAYKSGIALHALGETAAARGEFLRSLAARRLKMRLYSAIYLVLGLCRSRWIIP